MSVKITAEAKVNPTEDEEKVRHALLNIFPDATIQKRTDSTQVETLILNGEGLDFLSTFRSIIKQERIRSAARKIILGKMEDQRLKIYLHKQAAFAGRVSFCEPVGESPHGPITIEIRTTSPEQIVDYLASRPGQDGFQRFRST